MSPTSVNSLNTNIVIAEEHDICLTPIIAYLQTIDDTFGECIAILDHFFLTLGVITNRIIRADARKSVPKHYLRLGTRISVYYATYNFQVDFRRGTMPRSLRILQSLKTRFYSSLLSVILLRLAAHPPSVFGLNHTRLIGIQVTTPPENSAHTVCEKAIIPVHAYPVGNQKTSINEGGSHITARGKITDTTALELRGGMLCMSHIGRQHGQSPGGRREDPI